MITIIGVLISVILFHIFVHPLVVGFIDGYYDAKNGNPYNDSKEKEDNN